MNSKPYEVTFDNEKTYDDYIVTVYSAMARQRKKNKSISNYLTTHTYIPMWVLVNLLTFGNISKLFQIQTIDVQTKILDYYNIDTFKQENPELDVINFSNVLKILSIYRNICAHNERLYCFEINMNIHDSFMGYLELFPESTDVQNIKHTNHPLGEEKRKNLDRRRKGIPTLMFALKLFLTKADFNKIKTELDKELKKLSSKLPQDAYNNIVEMMGLNFKWKDSFN